MTPSRGLAVAALALALAACRDPVPPPTPPPRAAPTPGPGAAVPGAAARAREAVARADWRAAVALYREALAGAPDDVALHYELGVAATYLDDRELATREFRWVLAHATPDSAEYRTAKSWLAEGSSTGASGAPIATAVAAGPGGGAPAERPADASLYGRVTWSSEPNGPASTKRMQIHLYGLPGSPTKAQRYTVRTDEEGRYEFKRIVGGPYKVTDRVAGPPTWRLRVEIPPGRDTALDLHPGNSITARDDFPADAR